MLVISGRCCHDPLSPGGLPGSVCHVGAEHRGKLSPASKRALKPPTWRTFTCSLKRRVSENELELLTPRIFGLFQEVQLLRGTTVIDTVGCTYVEWWITNSGHLDGRCLWGTPL
jgi:hypothetical protein